MIRFARLWLISLILCHCFQIPDAQAQPEPQSIFGPFERQTLTPADKRFLQAALAFEGDYRGLLDGAWGPLSQSAFARYAQRRFATDPQDWHFVVLALEMLQRLGPEGWELRYFDEVGLSFLLPTKALISDPPHGQFASNLRHAHSSLTYAFGRQTRAEMRSIHQYTQNMHAGSDPYVMRGREYTVSSALMADGKTLYTRSDYRKGGWSTVMLSAGAQDVSLLNAVSSSISAGHARPVAVSKGGALDQAIIAARARIAASPGGGLLSQNRPKRSARDAVRPRTARLAKAAQPALPAPQSRTGGSGFYVTAEGHVLTNAHVVEGCGEIMVDGKAAELVDASELFDLALLRTDPDVSKAVAVFAQTPAMLNSDVTAFGYPYGGMLSGLNVTRGSVSAMQGLGGDGMTMQITAPIQQGNSGGPLVGPGGQVVGVVVAKLDVLEFADLMGDVPQNVNFAVRGEIARLFMAQNGLEAWSGHGSAQLSPVALAEQAQRFTAFIACN